MQFAFEQNFCFLLKYLQDFASHLTIHMDGVRGQLGYHQGNSVEEHLGITLTGGGKEYPLGVFTIKSGSG